MPQAPLFSIVIPTRARPDTLAHALKTATAQDFDNLEILVHESGDDHATAALLNAVSDPRVRHIKTVKPVTMTENWERALQAATGEYITFIGDDDGLLPDACSAAAEILRCYPNELLSWHPACYFWPQYIAPSSRNRLTAELPVSPALELQSSAVLLDLFYRFRCHYSRLPMIYNSFVSRALVNRVRGAAGRYFLGTAPDVASGIANAFFSDSFLFSTRLLSVSGLSHHSTGDRLYVSTDPSARAAASRDAFGSATPARGLSVYIGFEMLAVKNVLFPNRAPAFSYPQLIWSALQSLNRVPGDPEPILNEIRSLADLHGVDIKHWNHALPPSVPPAPAFGMRFQPDTFSLDIDCSRAVVSDIHGVTCLLHALMPAFALPNRTEIASPLTSLPPDVDTPLYFGSQGNGRLFLSYGWSENEPWGVWSLGSVAELVLPFSAPPSKSVDIHIAGRTLTHQRRPTLTGSIAHNGRILATFQTEFDSPEVYLRVSLSAVDLSGTEVALQFHFENARSPAQDGISQDSRPIGFGLEEISIEWKPL